MNLLQVKDGRMKGFLIMAACYMVTMLVNVMASWTLYARRRVLLIYPLLATFLFIAALLLFFFLSLRYYRAQRASAFKAQEARIQRFCNPFWRVTEEELFAATANFSCKKVIGRGRFGTVYRGILSNGQTVAVKRMNLEEPFAKKHFLSELHILGQLRHRNLLRILGFFHNAHEMILLSKFMANLNLDILLHGPQDSRLNWRQRLKIAVGVASALEYLHHGCCKNVIVHCDVKPANILLDEHLEPHLADFGLAQLLSNHHRTQSSLGSPLIFTVGYTAPERASPFTKTSPKGDVYSYGILLLELITGLKPTSSTLIEMGVTISQWARTALLENNCSELIDGCLKSESEFHGEIERVIRVGIQCAHESPERRPAMNDVAKSLEEIIGIKRQWNIPLDILAYQETETPMEDALLSNDSMFSNL